MEFREQLGERDHHRLVGDEHPEQEEGKDDVRSSYYLEDVATEFHVQGLELDWACITWDADFRYSKNGWEHWFFTGDHWNHVVF